MLKPLNTQSWPEVMQQDTQKVFYLLPISALEQHGRHLPLGTDDFILEAALQMLQKQPDLPAEFYCLPALHYGNSHEHLNFPGTVSLRCSTLCAIVEDVITSMQRSGFNRLILLNSHGGNSSLLDAYAQEWADRYGAEIYAIHLWASGFFADAATLVETPLANEIHAGEIETSILQFTKPKTVKEAERLPQNDCLCKLSPFKPGWLSNQLSPANGALGAASVANAEKGEKLVQYIAQKITQALFEISGG